MSLMEGVAERRRRKAHSQAGNAPAEHRIIAAAPAAANLARRRSATASKKAKLDQSALDFQGGLGVCATMRPAVGGCRQCARTFADRVELIQHMVDHFPAMFYSFDPLKYPQRIDPPVANRHPVPRRTTVRAITAARNADTTRRPSSRRSSRAISLNKCARSALNSDLPYHMCPHCCLTFSERSAYESHLAAHTEISQEGKGGSPSECQLGTASAACATWECGSTARSVFECHYCGEVFSEGPVFEEHLQMHFACNKLCYRCGRMFLSNFDLNLHIGTHDGFSYDCKDCGKCFETRKALSHHNKAHRVPFNSQGFEDSEDLDVQVPGVSMFKANTYISSLLSQHSSVKRNHRSMLAARANFPKPFIREIDDANEMSGVDLCDRNEISEGNGKTPLQKTSSDDAAVVDGEQRSYSAVVKVEIADD